MKAADLSEELRPTVVFENFWKPLVAIVICFIDSPLGPGTSL